MSASIALSGLMGCSLISVGLLEHNGRSKFSDWRVLAFLLVTRTQIHTEISASPTSSVRSAVQIQISERRRH